MINGIVLLDKPLGVTSNRALQIVKRLFNGIKAGHGGSLDPLATGLLPIYLGEATKFSRFCLEADKTYEVTALLGITTDTYDQEGQILQKRLVPEDLSIEPLNHFLKQWIGEQLQIPPMYSALKQQGQPLYKKARQGIVVEREARRIVIYDLPLQRFVRHEEQTTISLQVHCSKGTYIRSLVYDIGESLGCGACVTALRRLNAGPFKGSQMISLETLESLKSVVELAPYVLPIESALVGIPEIVLEDCQVQCLQQGQKIKRPSSVISNNSVISASSDIVSSNDFGWLVLKNAQFQFFGMGWLENGWIIPKRLMTQLPPHPAH